jgi:hypothetical protein
VYNNYLIDYIAGGNLKVNKPESNVRIGDFPLTIPFSVDEPSSVHSSTDGVVEK